MSGLLFLIGMWLQVLTTTASKRHKQTILRPKLRKKRAWLQVNNREGFLSKTWCTTCLLTAIVRCTIIPVRRDVGANYISDILCKIPGPAKILTLSVSQKWGIIQVTILSNLSMLGKELWYKWRFMFAYYNAIICLCMHHYSCTFLLSLCPVNRLNIDMDKAYFLWCQNWFIYSWLC